MNIKLKALAGACGILLCCVMIGVTAVQIVSMIPMAWLPWVGVACVIGMAIYIIYNMLLSEMQTQARLKEFNEQK